MATLDQIGAALKNAAAAGDTAAATKLAAAYRQMQQSMVAPAQGPPGSQAYAQWAIQQAKAGQPLPQIEGSAIPTPQQGYDSALESVRQAEFPQIPPDQFQQKTKAAGVFQPLNPQEIAQNDQLFGFGDEIAGGANALAAGLQGHDMGQSYSAFQKLQQARRDLGAEQSPLGGAASVVGQLTSLGAAAPVAAAAKTVTGFIPRALQVGKDMATSGTTGAVMGGVQGFGSANGDIGQRLEGAKQGAVAGGLVGAAAPVVARLVAAPLSAIAKNNAINAAIKNAPDAGDLRNISGQMFKAVDNSGVTVDTNKFSKFVNDLATQAKKDRINPTLDPKAYAAHEELINALGDVQSNGGALTVSDLHTLRQIAQRAAVSSEGRDGMFSQRIVDGLDKFVTTPGVLNFPPNRLASGQTMSTGNQLLGAIATWGRASKVGLIEDAVKAAQNYPSGVESGLRAQFKSLLNNRSTNRLFTEVERQAMQKVTRGGATVSALRILGMFKGLSGATLGGMFGGPLGAAAGLAMGAGGRKITEMTTEAAAQRAANVVATPNLHMRVPGPINIRVPYSTLPLLPSRQNQ